LGNDIRAFLYLCTDAILDFERINTFDVIFDIYV